MTVTTLNVTYRGFEIGYIAVARPNADGSMRAEYKPALRSSLDDGRRRLLPGGWRECFIYADGFDDLVPLAKQCIDYQCRVEATEAALGRKLEMHELTPDL